MESDADMDAARHRNAVLTPAAEAAPPQTPAPASRDEHRARRHRAENPRITAEKTRSGIESESQWLCPGPQWPPEDETCGRMLPHSGRCKECSATRMRLRKAARRQEAAVQREKGKSARDLRAEPAFSLGIPGF